MMTDPERHMMRLMRRLAHSAISASLVLLVGAAGADCAPGGIHVADAWSRATPPGLDAGAAYFVIHNNGGANDRLIGVSSPVAARAELHRTTTEGGLAQMRHATAVDVNSGERVLFAPGGRHVMLTGLKQPLREGDTFPLVLKFEKAGSVQIPVEVRGIAGMPRHDH